MIETLRFFPGASFDAQIRDAACKHHRRLQARRAGTDFEQMRAYKSVSNEVPGSTSAGVYMKMHPLFRATNDVSWCVSGMRALQTASYVLPPPNNSL